MKPVPRVNLEQSNNTLIHRVFSVDQTRNIQKVSAVNSDFLEIKKPREFYVLESSLENQKRVLTVRTQHVLINKTEASYQVRIFWIDKANKKVKIIHEVTLEKG